MKRPLSSCFLQLCRLSVQLLKGKLLQLGAHIVWRLVLCEPIRPWKKSSDSDFRRLCHLCLPMLPRVLGLFACSLRNGGMRSLGFFWGLQTDLECIRKGAFCCLQGPLFPFWGRRCALLPPAPSLRSVHRLADNIRNSNEFTMQISRTIILDRRKVFVLWH